MKKLKEVVDKQRDEIRAKDRELTLKNEDIEAVRTQKLGASMRRGCFFSSCVNYKEFRYFLYFKYKRGLVRSSSKCFGSVLSRNICCQCFNV